MTSNAYQFIPVPGYTQGATGTDPEILYSTAAHTQKGVTLASGQGILPAGCLVGRKTADKKYYVYSNAASDGTEVCRGVLRRGVDTTYGDQLGNIVIMGILKLDMLSGADASALTDLGAVTDSVRNTFKF
jgi:hypothetical protein